MHNQIPLKSNEEALPWWLIAGNIKWGVDYRGSVTDECWDSGALLLCLLYAVLCLYLKMMGSTHLLLLQTEQRHQTKERKGDKQDRSSRIWTHGVSVALQSVPGERTQLWFGIMILWWLRWKLIQNHLSRRSSYKYFTCKQSTCYKHVQRKQLHSI